MDVTSSSSHTLLDAKGARILANTLREKPETTHPVHSLRRGNCRAYIVGEIPTFKAAIIQMDYRPTEPFGFGSDIEALWQLFQVINGAAYLNVASEIAIPLGELIQVKVNCPVRYYRDSYRILLKPVEKIQNGFVRLLGLDDLGLLNSAPPELQGGGFGNPHDLISEGIVACAIISGEIVAIAHTSARSTQYADIGVFTQEKSRRKGFASAATSLVIQAVQHEGLIPVWSVGDDNIASLRIAEKFGFIEVAERQYIILEKPMKNT